MKRAWKQSTQLFLRCCCADESSFEPCRSDLKWPVLFGLNVNSVNLWLEWPTVTLKLLTDLRERSDFTSRDFEFLVNANKWSSSLHEELIPVKWLWFTVKKRINKARLYFTQKSKTILYMRVFIKSMMNLLFLLLSIFCSKTTCRKWRATPKVTSWSINNTNTKNDCIF